MKRFAFALLCVFQSSLNLRGQSPIDRMEIPFSLSGRVQVGDIRVGPSRVTRFEKRSREIEPAAGGIGKGKE